MVMRVIAEPAAARCRPALHVRRMSLLKIAAAARGGSTGLVCAHAAASGGCSRSPPPPERDPPVTVSRTLRQHDLDWPDLARCATIREGEFRSAPQPP